MKTKDSYLYIGLVIMIIICLYLIVNYPIPSETELKETELKETTLYFTEDPPVGIFINIQKQITVTELMKRIQKLENPYEPESQKENNKEKRNDKLVR